jgi:hypothetical protein
MTCKIISHNVFISIKTLPAEQISPTDVLVKSKALWGMSDVIKMAI